MTDENTTEPTNQPEETPQEEKPEVEGQSGTYEDRVAGGLMSQENSEDEEE